MRTFSNQELQKLVKPNKASNKEDNGQITIIGGSRLFHGAPLLALKTASRIVDMVFFTSPEESLKEIAGQIKSQLASFIWVPFKEREEYLKKSDAILIGPGLMRYRKESQKEKCRKKRICDLAGEEAKKITESLLQKFPKKQWVIDGGSLQVMAKEFIPPKAILTPNQRELKMLFKNQKPKEVAKKHNCIIVAKGPITTICSPQECLLVEGGNAGLTKGGTGDVLAGLTVALAAKNEPFLAASAASYLAKKAADELYQKVGFGYNADDLAEKIPQVLGQYFR